VETRLAQVALPIAVRDALAVADVDLLASLRCDREQPVWMVRVVSE
jgi:hypothetical protein